VTEPALGASTRGGRWRRAALAAVVGAAVLRAVVAPLRTLSADEAYYLWAARRSTPWPIGDHPPLLGALVSLANRCLPGPIELRVRLVAVVLQLATALAIAHTARAAHAARTKEDRTQEGEVAGLGAALLATWGVMPTAGGLLATPDAPLLCALSWLFALLAGSAGRPSTSIARGVGIAALAGAAVLSKAVALPLVAILAGAHLARRAHRITIALAVGALVAAPLAWRSLVLQAQHALGSGPLVSAPRIGPLVALGTLLVGQLLLWSPPLVVVGAVGLRRHTLVTGERGVVGALVLIVVASALLSGRPPEPNWTAPAALLVIVAASVELAQRARLRRWVVGLAAAPAVVVFGLWCAPIDRGPLARVPRPGQGPPLDAPRYGLAAWRCIYEEQCDEIEVISRH
jgi:hypothetical protein